MSKVEQILLKDVRITKEIKHDLFELFVKNIICFDFTNYLVYVNVTKNNINKNIGLNLDYRNNSIKYYSTQKSKYQNKDLSKTFAKQIFSILYMINKECTTKILDLYNITENDLSRLSSFTEYLEKSDYEPFIKRAKELNQYRKIRTKEIVQETHKNIVNKDKIKHEICNRVKEKTKHINSKDKRTKREEIFNFSSGFNCIAEAFGTKLEFKDDIEISSTSVTPYFKAKSKNEKSPRTQKEINSLILWDIENINFFDDFSIITRTFKKENQIKIVSFSKGYRDYYSANIDFELKKLKKRKWIIKEVKSSENSADKELIKEYYNYCDELKEVIIISSDSDFSEILIDSKNKNIKTMIIYKELNQKNRWFKNADEIIELNKIKGE
jgi:hypothetical protein